MDKIISKIFLYWLVSSLVFTTLVYLLWGKVDALSSIAGSTLVGFNLLALIWAWQRIYDGKGLALAAGVIVFKYAILGLSIYWLIVHNMVNPFGFLVGCGVLLIVMGFVSYDYKKQNLDKVQRKE